MTGKRHAILLVDAEAGIIASLKRVLSEIDAEILSALSGEEGLKLLSEQDVDLIISDQRMPNMTGTEFLAQSRESQPDAVRILLTGYADIDAVVGAINEGAIAYYFNKPWDNDLLLSRVEESLELSDMRSQNRHLLKLTQEQNDELKDMNSSLEERVEEQTCEIRQSHQELIDSFMQTIKAFSTMLELRFDAAGSHSQRVGALIKRLVKSLDLSQAETQDIVVAAYLHDIGKISIPDKVLLKPEGQYSPSDRELLAKHPEVGQSLVYQINGFEEVGVLIRSHHENYDGSGYPDRLVEQQIPLGSRLIRLADSFERYAFANGYPSKETLNEATAQLVLYTGKKFDPELVKKFIGCDGASEFSFKGMSETQMHDPDGLTEGMIIAVDVYTKNGMFLVPKGAKLSKGMINRIRKIASVDPISDMIQVVTKTETTEKEHEHV